MTPYLASDPAVDAAICRAIKAGTLIAVLYRSRGKDAAELKTVEPYGVLLGIRRYLVGIDTEDPQRRLRLYRAEAIEEARPLNEAFERDPGFELQDFAARAFGTFQDPTEIEKVVWRFRPEAADHARSFRFHPRQAMEDQPDGSLIVRFRACGQLEMCWHLYSWGDKVEVLAPERLRQMCERYRRADFPALP